MSNKIEELLKEAESGDIEACKDLSKWYKETGDTENADKWLFEWMGRRVKKRKQEIKENNDTMWRLLQEKNRPPEEKPAKVIPYSSFHRSTNRPKKFFKLEIAQDIPQIMESDLEGPFELSATDFEDLPEIIRRYYLEGDRESDDIEVTIDSAYINASVASGLTKQEIREIDEENFDEDDIKNTAFNFSGHYDACWYNPEEVYYVMFDEGDTPQYRYVFKFWAD